MPRGVNNVDIFIMFGIVTYANVFVPIFEVVLTLLWGGAVYFTVVEDDKDVHVVFACLLLFLLGLLGILRVLAHMFGTHVTTGFAVLLNAIRLRMTYSMLVSACMCDQSVVYKAVRYYGLAAVYVLQGGLKSRLDQLDGTYQFCNSFCEPSEWCHIQLWRWAQQRRRGRSRRLSRPAGCHRSVGGGTSSSPSSAPRARLMGDLDLPHALCGACGLCERVVR